MELTNFQERWLRYLCCSVLLGMLFSSGTAHAQVSGFLVTTLDLWERDLQTLASTNVGPTGAIASAGLAMRADGTLYSIPSVTSRTISGKSIPRQVQGLLLGHSALM